MFEIPDHGECGLFAGRTPQPVEFWLYRALHEEGKELIRSWARRSYETDDPFESFIYCWIAVNGWGACIAETDTDQKWVDAIAANDALSKTFEALRSDDDGFNKDAQEFAALWPIFQSSDIRRQGIYVPQEMPRDQRIAHYLKAGLTRCEPTCCQEHNGNIPIDWAHTFLTLYRVRCNLFHGEKTMNNDNDRRSRAPHALLIVATSVITVTIS